MTCSLEARTDVTRGLSHPTALSVSSLPFLGYAFLQLSWSDYLGCHEVFQYATSSPPHSNFSLHICKIVFLNKACEEEKRLKITGMNDNEQGHSPSLQQRQASLTGTISPEHSWLLPPLIQYSRHWLPFCHPRCNECRELSVLCGR